MLEQINHDYAIINMSHNIAPKNLRVMATIQR